MSGYNLQKAADRTRFRKDFADELAAAESGTWPRHLNDFMRWSKQTSEFAAEMCRSNIEYIDDLEARIVAGDPGLACFESQPTTGASTT